MRIIRTTESANSVVSPRVFYIEIVDNQEEQFENRNQGRKWRSA